MNALTTGSGATGEHRTVNCLARIRRWEPKDPADVTATSASMSVRSESDWLESPHRKRSVGYRHRQVMAGRG